MKRRKIKTPEGEVKDAICAWLALQSDVWWQRNVAGPVRSGARQRKGLPDLIVCVGGRFLGMEVKAPGEKASDHQREQIDAIHKAGGRAGTVHSLDAAICVVESMRREVAAAPWA